MTPAAVLAFAKRHYAAILLLAAVLVTWSEFGAIHRKLARERARNDAQFVATNNAAAQAGEAKVTALEGQAKQLQVLADANTTMAKALASQRAPLERAVAAQEQDRQRLTGGTVAERNARVPEIVARARAAGIDARVGCR